MDQERVADDGADAGDGGGADGPASWALEAVRSTNWARTASMICLGLAAFTVVVAIIGVVATVSMHSTTGSFGGSVSWDVTVREAAAVVITAALPIGLLVAAAAALRVYASRLEIDLLDD